MIMTMQRYSDVRVVEKRLLLLRCAAAGCKMESRDRLHEEDPHHIDDLIIRSTK